MNHYIRNDINNNNWLRVSNKSMIYILQVEKRMKVQVKVAY